MASLMEDLIEVLNQECIAYDELLGLSSKKTPVIAAGDLEKLSQITMRSRSPLVRSRSWKSAGSK